jgi:hypothetical protein
MPVAGIAAGFAVDALAGSTIAAGVADLGITGVAASAATGAIEGAIGGGITGAVTGGNIGSDIIKGALSGGVGAGVTGLVSEALSPGTLPDLTTQGTQLPPEIGGSQALGKGVAAGLGKFAGGLAAGQSVEQAALGGLAGGVGTGLGSALNLGGLGTSALTGALGYAANLATQPSAKGSSASSVAYQPTLAQNVASPGISNAPSTSLLGSALNVGGTSGYTPGGTVFGSSDSNTPPSNVWNQATLRDTTVGQG